MSLNANKICERTYAHPFDRPMKTDDDKTHGVGRNSEAIGGYTGIGWYETFRDYMTGELFRVHCTDGVNGGKSAHTDGKLGWMVSCRDEIIKRTKHEAESGVDQIRISSPEWAVMLKFTFFLWLDTVEGQEFKTVGDSNCHIDYGQIGTINGVPVVVDPELECPLSQPL